MLFCREWILLVLVMLLDCFFNVVMCFFMFCRFSFCFCLNWWIWLLIILFIFVICWLSEVICLVVCWLVFCSEIMEVFICFFRVVMLDDRDDWILFIEIFSDVNVLIFLVRDCFSLFKCFWCLFSLVLLCLLDIIYNFWILLLVVFRVLLLVVICLVREVLCFCRFLLVFDNFFLNWVRVSLFWWV